MRDMPLHPNLASLERDLLLIRDRIDSGAVTLAEALVAFADNVVTAADGSLWSVDLLGSGDHAEFFVNRGNGNERANPSDYVPASPSPAPEPAPHSPIPTPTVPDAATAALTDPLSLAGTLDLPHSSLTGPPAQRRTARDVPPIGWVAAAALIIPAVIWLAGLLIGGSTATEPEPPAETSTLITLPATTSAATVSPETPLPASPSTTLLPAMPADRP